MPNNRLRVHQTLCNVLGCAEIGEECRCHYQRPSNRNMVYPAIVYRLSGIPTSFADNTPYVTTGQYQLTLIDRNPESEFVEEITKLPKARFVRFFIADGLNHWIYNIY